MKNNKKIPKNVCDIELSNTFFKTPNFSLEILRRYTGVILWDEHTYNAKKSRNIMTLIVASQHKRGRIKFVLRIKIFVKVLTRASVSEAWKTCDRTAVNSKQVNSGKPKFQFHISRQRKEMGRPGETCYGLILYFSYLQPYLLFHFVCVHLCNAERWSCTYACTTAHLWLALELNVMN